VKARHILGWSPLRPERDDWIASPTLPVGGLEGALLPRLDIPAEPASAIPQEEAALIARAREGDQEAFGALVRRHQRQVYLLALRMLRDSEEAIEATQEVFLAAWQGLRGFRGDARFATWMYRIAYNHCLKVTQSHRRDSAVRAALREESSRAQSPTSIVSAQHAQAAEQEMRETVRAEIANLPPKYRAVLILRHLQDLSYEEMAEVMRMPIGTVKTQLFRARALLKERLEGFGLGHAEGLTGGLAQGIARAGEIGAGLRSMLERRWESPRKGED
jgi:RNA polymerase sigma-70 factor (ECF subfamily)